ncbi:MAG: sulfatase-like hydrolase/transferase [Candidatus Latescibacteria bacterium]|nr:sulfatase-like hydrolase/transferase [Candidatus Latescibacterota bacterium]
MKKHTRRGFLKKSGEVAVSTGALSFLPGCGSITGHEKKRRYNVILILTDDQGYGDVGCHGNDIIKTPNLDRFALENIEFTRFYVCPTCAPTRAGLLTGRYHHRTGIQGVMSGEALINPDEITIAEMFGNSGYTTGIFGKWHLGDNYPRRPMEKGFFESVVHNGGGLSQPSCPPGKGYFDPEFQKKHNFVLPEYIPHWLGSNAYFDPLLQHNGQQEQYKGYCTDIFFNEAKTFIEKHRAEPFFVYLPLNAPHAPEFVSEDYLAPYRNKGLDDKTARCYAMITNIDDNFGRLINKLEELKLEENTILIFLGDNGPQYLRYNAGIRDRKGSFYEGGFRVPCFMRFPGMMDGSRKTDTIAANIDICPTLLEACDVGKPAGVKLDGMSLLSLLENSSIEWPARTLFFQGNNGVPEKYNQCAALTQQYKLVNGKELYDIIEDPSEKNDISGNHPDIVAKLRSEYEKWFDDVVNTRGQEPQYIYVGTSHENPVILTPQDWRGPRSRFVSEDSLGYWLIDVRSSGTYEITLRFKKKDKPVIAHLTIGDKSASQECGKEATSVTFDSYNIDTGKTRLDGWLEIDNKSIGVDYVDVRKLDRL